MNFVRLTVRNSKMNKNVKKLKLLRTSPNAGVPGVPVVSSKGVGVKAPVRGRRTGYELSGRLRIMSALGLMSTF